MNTAKDHFSFHYSGQSHVKLDSLPKDILIDKNFALHQSDIGAFILFSARFDPRILPTSPPKKDGDILFNVPTDSDYLWCELCFS